jgi:hypothetical protein
MLEVKLEKNIVPTNLGIGEIGLGVNDYPVIGTLPNHGPLCLVTRTPVSARLIRRLSPGDEIRISKDYAKYIYVLQENPKGQWKPGTILFEAPSGEIYSVGQYWNGGCWSNSPDEMTRRHLHEYETVVIREDGTKLESTTLYRIDHGVPFVFLDDRHKDVFAIKNNDRIQYLSSTSNFYGWDKVRSLDDCPVRILEPHEQVVIHGVKS